ncbi:MAG TPA: TetR/AcrR family transcriptional regulator [Mycobacterium sp.]
MTIEERRARDRAARRRLIVATARRLAETEGWDAVTTRRLATEIEYSQPVLYKHFSGMDEITQSVALDGFGELAAVLSEARTGAENSKNALRRIAHVYIDFARDNPALYDAMFTRATTLKFADAGTPPQLSAAFAGLPEAVVPIAGDRDVDTLTEVLWAALHGLTALARSGRLRGGLDIDRVDLLADQFAATLR